jgi:hypothetical protein
MGAVTAARHDASSNQWLELASSSLCSLTSQRPATILRFVRLVIVDREESDGLKHGRKEKLGEEETVDSKSSAGSQQAVGSSVVVW